jgi:hypothetical protein
VAREGFSINSFTVRVTKCYWNYQIKQGKIGGARSTHGRDRKCVNGFCFET